MTITEDKLNLELPCNLEPFGYIEDTQKINTKNSGKLTLIAFGALNHLGHYAPEFGGVALVCTDPDIIVAIKYIPWNTEARKAEVIDQIVYLQNNHETMSPQNVTDYFYGECHYTLPSQKQRLKEEYFLKIATENKARATELKKQNQRIQDLQKDAMGDVRAASLKEHMTPRTPEEVQEEAEEDACNENTCEDEDNNVEYHKPILKLVQGGENAQKEKKPKMVDGEELIPLNEEE